jgi:hypothetical protein
MGFARHVLAAELDSKPTFLPSCLQMLPSDASKGLFTSLFLAMLTIKLAQNTGRNFWSPGGLKLVEQSSPFVARDLKSQNVRTGT